MDDQVFQIEVAPLAGAWIEITAIASAIHAGTVAPLAGAWIEIVIGGHIFGIPGKSLPSRERGLKFLPRQRPTYPHMVAPLAGAWIEIETAEGRINYPASLPSRERGLKFSVG